MVLLLCCHWLLNIIIFIFSAVWRLNWKKDYHKINLAFYEGSGDEEVNPSNAEATFIQRTGMQRFLKTI